MPTTGYEPHPWQTTAKGGGTTAGTTRTHLRAAMTVATDVRMDAVDLLAEAAETTSDPDLATIYRETLWLLYQWPANAPLNPNGLIAAAVRHAKKAQKGAPT